MIYLYITGLALILIGTAALAWLVAWLLDKRRIRRLPIEQVEKTWQEQELARLHVQELEREKHLHELQLAEREMALKERTFEAKFYLATTQLTPTAHGYPILLPQTQLPFRPIMFPHGFGTRVTEEKEKEPAAQLQLIAAGVRQPMQRYLLDQLEENGLQVSPGVRTSDGQPVILSIPDAVHFKLIGSSGFGKSCLAAALLDQAVKLNSPGILQIALLDLEHKTSRLFENSPNVGSFQIGRRTVPMVAASADEVATHLGYLKKELDRRALLSEYDLQCEALLLMYVEEMLSLQYEASDELIEQMLKDLSVLAIRGRKYGMFLLACAQTDYSTPELKTAQKQFRSRMAFAIDTTAARSAGFMSTELIKYSFTHSQKGDGLYVLETPGVASLMLSPVYDVRQKVLALDARSRDFRPVSRTFQDDFTVESETGEKDTGNLVKAHETPVFSFSEKAAEVAKLRQMNWGKVAIVERVWNVKAGGSAAYQQACEEYNQIIESES